MHKTKAAVIVCIAAFAMTAAAQTPVTNGNNGVSGAVPVYSGSATLGSGSSSPITVSGGNVAINGMISTTAAAPPAAATYVMNSYPGTFTTYAWDVVNAQLTNPTTASSTQYNGYLAAPVVTATDGTSRQVVGGMFSPSLIASGATSTNYLYGLVAYGSIDSSSNTSGFTSLYGGNFGAGTEFNVPAATQVTNVNVVRLSPSVQGGSVTAVRGAWVTPAFGATNGPASLVIPNYYGLELGAPAYANGATITNNYGISQEDSAAKNFFAGKVGVGTTAPAYALDVAGQIRSSSGGVVFPDGTTQTTAFIPANCGADFAESVGVTGSRPSYEPGDLMVIDPNAPGKFIKSNQAYSTLVAGIYSTKPGFVGRKQPPTPETNATEVPMAMVGRVPTKVTAENGPIKVGDLLVSSSRVGYAMKGTDRTQMLGAVIGKALGPLDSGTGVIEVLVTLQ